MMGGFAGHPPLEPATIAAFDLDRQLTLGTESEGWFFLPPGCRKKPQSLPPGIRYSFPLG